MVLVLVLTDVLVVPDPLPLGFNWMDFSFVAPGTHDQMVCFLFFDRRGVWQPVQRRQACVELAVGHLVLGERWPEDVGR